MADMGPIIGVGLHQGLKEFYRILPKDDRKSSNSFILQSMVENMSQPYN